MWWRREEAPRCPGSAAAGREVAAHRAMARVPAAHSDFGGQRTAYALAAVRQRAKQRGVRRVGCRMTQAPLGQAGRREPTASRVRWRPRRPHVEVPAGLRAATVDGPQPAFSLRLRLALQHEPPARGHGRIQPLASCAARADRSDQGRDHLRGGDPVSCGQLAAGLDQLYVHDAAGRPSLVLTGQRPALQPRRGPGGQGCIHGTRMAVGQRLGACPSSEAWSPGSRTPGRSRSHHDVLAAQR